MATVTVLDITFGVIMPIREDINTAVNHAIAHFKSQDSERLQNFREQLNRLNERQMGKLQSELEAYALTRAGIIAQKRDSGVLESDEHTLNTEQEKLQTTTDGKIKKIMQAALGKGSRVSADDISELTFKVARSTNHEMNSDQLQADLEASGKGNHAGRAAKPAPIRER